MNSSIDPNRALIPRNKEKPENIDDNYKEIEDELKPYAPAGARWKAKVRHLGDSESLTRVQKVDENGGQKKPTQVVQKENGKDISIRFETEVKLTGKIPPEGVVIETSTRVKPDK